MRYTELNPFLKRIAWKGESPDAASLPTRWKVAHLVAFSQGIDEWAFHALICFVMISSMKHALLTSLNKNPNIKEIH